MTVMGDKLGKEVKVLRACGAKKKDPTGFHFWFTKANEEFFLVMRPVARDPEGAKIKGAVAKARQIIRKNTRVNPRKVVQGRARFVDGIFKFEGDRNFSTFKNDIREFAKNHKLRALVGAKLYVGGSAEDEHEDFDDDLKDESLAEWFQSLDQADIPAEPDDNFLDNEIGPIVHEFEDLGSTIFDPTVLNTSNELRERARTLEDLIISMDIDSLALGDHNSAAFQNNRFTVQTLRAELDWVVSGIPERERDEVKNIDLSTLSKKQLQLRIHHLSGLEDSLQKEVSELDEEIEESEDLLRDKGQKASQKLDEIDTFFKELDPELGLNSRVPSLVQYNDLLCSAGGKIFDTDQIEKELAQLEDEMKPLLAVDIAKLGGDPLLEHLKARSEMEEKRLHLKRKLSMSRGDKNEAMLKVQRVRHGASSKALLAELKAIVNDEDSGLSKEKRGELRAMMRSFGRDAVGAQGAIRVLGQARAKKTAIEKHAKENAVLLKTAETYQKALGLESSFKYRFGKLEDRSASDKSRWGITEKISGTKELRKLDPNNEAERQELIERGGTNAPQLLALSDELRESVEYLIANGASDDMIAQFFQGKLPDHWMPTSLSETHKLFMDSHALIKKGQKLQEPEPEEVQLSRSMLKLAQSSNGNEVLDIFKQGIVDEAQKEMSYAQKKLAHKLTAQLMSVMTLGLDGLDEATGVVSDAKEALSEVVDGVFGEVAELVTDEDITDLIDELEIPQEELDRIAEALEVARGIKEDVDEVLEPVQETAEELEALKEQFLKGGLLDLKGEAYPSREALMRDARKQAARKQLIQQRMAEKQGLAKEVDPIQQMMMAEELQDTVAKLAVSGIKITGAVLTQVIGAIPGLGIAVNAVALFQQLGHFAKHIHRHHKSRKAADEAYNQDSILYESVKNIRNRDGELAGQEVGHGIASALCIAADACLLAGVSAPATPALLAGATLVNVVTDTSSIAHDISKASKTKEKLEQATQGDTVAQKDIFRIDNLFAVSAVAVAATREPEPDPIALKCLAGFGISPEMVRKSTPEVIKKYLQKRLKIDDDPATWEDLLAVAERATIILQIVGGMWIMTASWKAGGKIGKWLAGDADVAEIENTMKSLEEEADQLLQLEVVLRAFSESNRIVEERSQKEGMSDPLVERCATRSLEISQELPSIQMKICEILVHVAEVTAVLQDQSTLDQIWLGSQGLDELGDAILSPITTGKKIVKDITDGVDYSEEQLTWKGRMRSHFVNIPQKLNRFLNMMETV